MYKMLTTVCMRTLYSFSRQMVLRALPPLNSNTRSYIFTLKKVKCLCVTAWPSEKNTGNKERSLQTDHSNVRLSPDVFQIQLNKKLMSLKTVEDLLDLFDTNKSMDTVNRRTVLHKIAKIAHKDARKLAALDQKNLTSAYSNLLSGLKKDVPQCNPRHLANLLWALGKLQEKTHSLVQVCAKEFLASDISLFNNAQVCQIVNGSSLLGVKGAKLMSKVEEAILQGKVKLSTFEDWQLNSLLMPFAKTDKGSDKFYRHLMKEISRRDVTRFNNQSLVGFVWSFAEVGMFEDRLFRWLEQEVLNRRLSGFKHVEVIMTLTAFAKAGKRSNELFAIFDSELLFWNLQEFQPHQLGWMVWSFTKADTNSPYFVKNCLEELCSRNLMQLDNGSFTTLAWCMGRSGLVNHKLFDKIEQIILQRNASDLTIKQICALKRGFIEANRKTRKLFTHLEPAILKNIRNLSADAICELLWCVSRPGFKAGFVLSTLEKEVVRRGKSYFHMDQLKKMQKYFVQAKLKGSPVLCEMFEGQVFQGENSDKV